MFFFIIKSERQRSCDLKARATELIQNAIVLWATVPKGASENALAEVVNSVLVIRSEQLSSIGDLSKKVTKKHRKVCNFLQRAVGELGC